MRMESLRADADDIHIMTGLPYNADFVVIAAPTNYDSVTQHFNTTAVENVIELVMKANPNAIMAIKSTVPVGYTASVREK